ncbi:carboxylesterase/lipase family protein [Paenibacillus farraposensis]|uniref:Carboxylic ester hydrolase n=1 Tax=Paenibacillus farraposensis TaxID=2807095 RepID=A0ABW4DD15_9BACL|nr:carboxylesterase/lipase family protein [Paenibacillus farraposensis]MCC3381988.1 carboxylesterase/lipase family protein [Paenibacillus farraposensis]
MKSITVHTRLGQLRGEARDGYCVWKGIPYAQPPVGELRFRAPRPLEPWEGVRAATSFGPICPQPMPSADSMTGNLIEPPKQSEDCLYLNVWTPASEVPGEGRPVMVWIHGGAFVTGSGIIPLYDGARMANKGDVVVVTINYRLGPLGFLHLTPRGDGLASNAGLLDQIAALEWVRDHIAAFGGNPDEVTVFGESAGAMSIAALLAMPAAKGLFQRAILQSGASQVLPTPQAEQVAAVYLQRLGVDARHPERLFTLPTEALMLAMAKTHEAIGTGMAMLYQPVVDGVTLPHVPLTAIARGSAKQVRVLIGTNLHEGAYFIRKESHLMNRKTACLALEMMTGMSDFAELIEPFPVTIEGQAQMMTDLYFWRSALALAAAQSEYAPVWMYRFDWTLPGHPTFKEAVHGAEIAFVFDNLEPLRKLGLDIQPSMRALAHDMQQAWSAFASTGKPVLSEREWPAYDREKRATTIFHEEIMVKDDPEGDKRRKLTGQMSI